MEFPKDLKYTDNDEWVRLEGEIGTAGITDYAQDQLSDVVYVEVLSSVGEKVEKGSEFGLVESVKAAADVYMPISGTITQINDELIDAPETVNDDPYGNAWMIKFEAADPSEMDDLMDAEAYAKYVEERSD